MKKFLLIFIFLLSLIAGAVIGIALPKLERDIQTRLSQFGFKVVTASDPKITLSGIEIGDIQFDEDGFNHVLGLKAKVFWPRYLLDGRISSVTINEIKSSHIGEDLRNFSLWKKRRLLKKMQNLSINEVTVDKITADITTKQGAIRVEGKFTVKGQEEKNLTASITARQHQLTFDSQWHGTLSNEATKIEGNIEQLNINYTPVNTYRGTGWLSYQQEGTKVSLSGNIEAGSGKFFNLPLKNMNLVLGQGDGHYPILFRAQAAGVENVNLTTDIHIARKVESQRFLTTLDIEDFAIFLNYLKQHGVIDNPLTDAKKDAVNIVLDYQASKRFPSGPIPFDFNMMQGSKNKLKSTFLIYPGSLDIRGTAESDKDILNLLKTITPLKEENITDNTIRIDGNLKFLLN